jgi:uncharacterized protein YwqG
MKMNTAIVISILATALIGFAFYHSKAKQKAQPPAAHDNKASQQFTDTFRRDKKMARTAAFLKERFDKLGLSNHWAFFQSHLKPEILAEPKAVTEKDLVTGQSKIGGQPDMPANTEWCKEDNGKRLSFIAQINLAEVSPYDQFKSLPARGMLYFFYSAGQEAWGFDIKDKDKFKVLYYEGSMEELKRKEFPNDLAEPYRYKPCRLTFQSSVSLPNWEQPYVTERFTKAELQKYIDATEEPDLDVEANKILGHSDNIQGPMELECELVTNELYCGDATGFNDPKARALEKNADNWTLL